MKTFLFVFCFAVSLTGFAQSEPGGKVTTTDPTLRELVRLQQEFDRRRAEAVRPVTTWYRAQLEALERQLSDPSPTARTEVEKALKSARETFWRDDQPELTQALLAGSWIWRSEDDADGVVVAFHADGSVDHIGMKGTWRITGPCEVTIHTTDEEQYVLRFDASLSAYEADRRSVSGCRIAQVTSVR